MMAAAAMGEWRSAVSRTASPSDEFDAQSCSLCMESFATAADGQSISSDRRPRVLSCGHSFCGSCLHLDMQRRRCCATCRAPISFASAAVVPVNFELIASLQSAEAAARRVAALQLQVDQAHAAHRQTAAAPCAECDQAAAHFCEQCNVNLCAAHSQQAHALKIFQSHNVVAIAEKAALVAAAQKREQKARANKCTLHPDQIKYLYCTDCDEAICTVCVYGKHAEHKKIEIAAAAANARKMFDDQLVKITGSGGGVNSVGTLADAERLGHQLREMKQGVVSSSVSAQRGVESLGAELKAAVDRRCAMLVQQLQRDEAAATSVIDRLLVGSDQIAAAGAQLRDEISAAAASDDYGALDAAPRVSQLFVDMEAQLSALAQQAAAVSGPVGCVSALRLDDGAKAAALAELTKIGTIKQQRTKIARGQSAAVKPAAAKPVAVSPAACGPSASLLSSSSAAAASMRPTHASVAALFFASSCTAASRPLQQLQSRVLPPASEATLLQFFKSIPVPARLLYRASRDGFERRDWTRRCMGKGPTMTLVKAKESGFVFGAYSHCKWPDQENEHLIMVPDSSGHSFLFSLTNAANKPVRFSLRNRDQAFGPSGSGVFFGWNGANFVLHYDGASSDDDGGNTAWRLDERSSYRPDDGDLNRGAEFFAGSEYFAAADIEVYEL